MREVYYKGKSKEFDKCFEKNTKYVVSHETFIISKHKVYCLLLENSKDGIVIMEFDLKKHFETIQERRKRLINKSFKLF